MTRMR